MHYLCLTVFESFIIYHWDLYVSLKTF